MKPKDPKLCFADRAESKEAARAKDEADLVSGKVSAAEMARINGGGARKVRHVGPSERIQNLARVNHRSGDAPQSDE